MKRRTIQVEALGASSARMGHYIAIEVLTGPFLWVLESPWLFALQDLEVAERLRDNRSIGVGRSYTRQPVIADVRQFKLGTGF